MANRRVVRFRQVEESRAIRGVVAAGLCVDRVECRTDGTIIVHTAKEAPEPPEIGVARNAADVVAERLR
jgi:hypothetical protein